MTWSAAGQRGGLAPSLRRGAPGMMAGPVPPEGRVRPWGSEGPVGERHPIHTRALGLVRAGSLRGDRARWRRLETRAAGRSGPGRALMSAVRALTEAVNARDACTRAHCVRVGLLGGSIARELGLPALLCRDIVLGGLVHDVGKIGVPRPLLHKPCRLTRREQRTVQQHPVTGEEILRGLLADRPTVLAIVRSHHERYDGAGYPDRLRGTRIPVAARVVAVADAFDAMTSRRPYRRPLPMRAALTELILHAGTQFDRACVTALIRLIRRGARLRTHIAAQFKLPDPPPRPSPVSAVGPRRPPMGPGPWGTSLPP